ncbi:ChrR family anti-sigma-E factor [Ferrimonas lipolytica]|uniref:ChrR-like cupin domain-containing protein n=1 Tax=Ferrimonas lipolytica TaxID=2724191 RepID=A0A6H1UBD6_9GAMM|nr:ChrR family anti-sigma-E factor [Ferrimonas lipolytica]QIZ75673.1 hypothetical protein HER31_01400 [Ferrimonas lipolytica]
MSNITHHPSLELIQRFANGELIGGTALLVSAHTEMCRHCQQLKAQHEQVLAQQSLTNAAPNTELDDMLTSMLASLPDVDRTPPSPLTTARSPLTLQQHRFELPRVLANQLDKLGSWSSQPGKLHQARLDLGDHSLQLIHMDRNSTVPAHTHKGNEVTLVLHGGFSDDQGDYKLGDFIALDQRHEHQPRTDDHEDCLVISAVDAPLHFTSGLARMLNPLSNLFFKP